MPPCYALGALKSIYIGTSHNYTSHELVLGVSFIRLCKVPNGILSSISCTFNSTSCISYSVSYIVPKIQLRSNIPSFGVCILLLLV
jgi:hypothetical protein